MRRNPAKEHQRRGTMNDKLARLMGWTVFYSYDSMKFYWKYPPDPSVKPRDWPPDLLSQSKEGDDAQDTQ